MKKKERSKMQLFLDNLFKSPRTKTTLKNPGKIFLGGKCGM